MVLISYTIVSEQNWLSIKAQIEPIDEFLLELINPSLLNHLLLHYGKTNSTLRPMAYTCIAEIFP